MGACEISIILHSLDKTDILLAKKAIVTDYVAISNDFDFSFDFEAKVSLSGNCRIFCISLLLVWIKNI